MNNIKNKKLAIIGLGYVGIPLAVEFVKNDFDVIGFDINEDRINELKKGIDNTGEVTSNDKGDMAKIKFTHCKKDIKNSDIFIVTVPTPIDHFKQPDLKPILSASRLVAKNLNKGNIVIYESTVYPGCTEEDCVPVLEKYSGMTFNEDFFCGYSPERINPGDKKRRVHNIIKVTSGSTAEIANVVDELYNQIITVGTHKVSSIKVAEASKIIENTQRDLNISLVNEFALIFDRLNIDTEEILEAAGTKWNFLPFRPGLVGGHCISVDPYYLTHKAQSLGYYPEVILSGRRINDNMGLYIANRVIKLMVKNNLTVTKSRILVLGITFKENCPDIRNSRVIDMIREFKNFGADVDVYDPCANVEEVFDEYGFSLAPKIGKNYDAIILAVGHNNFKKINLGDIKSSSKTVIFDIKSFFQKQLVTDRL
ncbi:nucleotide sugar dehydrogenase [Maribacter sp. PR1]|uniref:Nucleotide sugar dehydrogenase n=1 Tax=Maribacter cobaltidurans TaxID=1178778 RepID=A0ABU7IZ63_9FLAO|nr:MULTISPECIES: nucleotide sugar dehydrogenase [Maribacter]MDC6390900.1 nucleotide sugar dehydrogenase [Maribacter sp. PR1]MEE1978292.1 nucleotide sugar dehydrogenase [Maribacter cobaltidurans]